MNEELLLGLERLNQLALTEAERKRVLDFFAALADAEAALAVCDTDGVEPMVHLIPLTNVLREDVSFRPFSRERLLESAPEKMNGYWQVPRLVE